MPFSFIQDKNSYAAATNADGTLVLDLQSDPITVWKVRILNNYILFF
jgi:hypothetical protein